MLMFLPIGNVITYFIWGTPVLWVIQIAGLIKSFTNAFSDRLERRKRIRWAAVGVLISFTIALDLFLLFFIF